VVSQDEYNRQMSALRSDGNVGRLGPELNVLQNLPGTTPPSERE